ncbi:cytochrome d ubiquinol oxidase subunit II [Salinisphaera orenii]|uniref:Cytochrome BD oxidase subunit II n=1 Tax=Salinisphaera orenii YIM 95161 TaxID=1051139 RepID=A0A423QAP7_9GAMM|nr:cytochrome d ubiquinol oxidase subunit II [Salinisphaera halophila]ROO37625.1 cytochrome BD oxidase subunit II [Salinisphaera halophila YIM 95161]
MEIYIVLKLVWWALLGVLLIGLAVMVGMDMGVGAGLRYLGRTDRERRTVINMIAPHWDGNQVWFILGGGAVFAAWPTIYATAFSGLYVVMLVLLWSMIVRPLGFEYRSKLPSQRWRNLWDVTLFISGAVPMIVFGAAMGNMLRGVPFHFEWNMVSYYTGSFIALFNPFAVLCGLMSIALALYQGGAMVMNRGTGVIRERACNLLTMAGLGALVLFTVCGLWVWLMPGYVLTGGAEPAGPAMPLRKTVQKVSGAWLNNFAAYPLLWLVPGLVYAGVLAGIACARRGLSHVAWWLGALAWAGTIGTVGTAMFPFLMPSSTNPGHSLTVWDASSSATTLGWMLAFTAIFIPIVAVYTSWAFWVMRGKVTPETIEHDEHAY